MRIILWTCLLGIGLSVQAQDFSSYYQQAADNHPALKAIFQEYYAMMERKAQVNKLPPPELAFGAFILPVETRLGAQRLKTGITQMFPPVGQLRAREALIDQQAAAKRQQAEILRNQLYFDIQQEWYQLLQLNALTEIETKQLDRYEIYEQLILKKIEAGQARIDAIYRIELERQERQKNIALFENQAILHRYAFKTLLNQQDSLLELTFPDSVPLRSLDYYPKDSLREWIQQQNPNLQQIELQKLVLEQQKKLRETQNKPAFGLGVDYVWVTQRPDADPRFDGRDIVMAKGMIKVPLYKKQNQARLKEVELKKEVLDFQKEHLQNQLALQLQKALNKYDATTIELNHYQKQLKYVDKTLEVLIRRFSEDTSDFEEILRMENKKFEIYKAIIKIKIKRNQAVMRVEQLFAAPL